MRQWIVAAAGAALLWPASAGAATPAAEQKANQVAQCLRESGQLKNYRVGVKYEDGVAWLMGSVTSAEQSATAEQLASEVEGVTHVVNKLEIVEPATPSVAKSETPLKLASLDQSEPQGLEASLEAAPLPPNPMPAAQSPAQGAPSRGMPLAMRPAAGMHPQGMHPGMYPGVPPQGVQPAQYGAAYAGGGMPQGQSTGGAQGASYDSANMPNYAWPSYAAHPNYAAVSYPQQYSPAAWPYIGPFYPYPQVPLGWRKVTLEWDDGWWFLDFKDSPSNCW
jgi:hypothetical protein